MASFAENVFSVLSKFSFEKAAKKDLLPLALFDNEGGPFTIMWPSCLEVVVAK